MVYVRTEGPFIQNGYVYFTLGAIAKQGPRSPASSLPCISSSAGYKLRQFLASLTYFPIIALCLRICDIRERQRKAVAFIEI